MVAKTCGVEWQSGLYPKPPMVANGHYPTVL